MTVFAIIAVLFTLATVGLVAWPLLRSHGHAHPVAATLTAVVIPATVLVVYLLVSNHDWQATATGASSAASENSAAQSSVEEAIASLERKLQAAPGDEEGWILLGSSYLSLNRPADAANAYQKALDVSGGRNVAARLGVAESRIVLDPGSLMGPVGDEIEAVLQAEPQNPKGLWYGGLLSMARGQPEIARERWQALLALSPPQQVREIIESQLAEMGGSSATASTEPQQQPQSASADGIDVSVTVSDVVRNQVAPTAPVFVFVRDAQAAGPPLAVIRRQARELPMKLRITDADIMLPGRSLSGVANATLVARIANGGDPIAKPGDVYGEASWTRQGSSGPISIVIDQVVGP